jgi:hypothetical protein
MTMRPRAVAVTTAVAAAIMAVVTWKDSLRGHTNNNRESAKVDAFSRFHDVITSLVSIMAHLFAN